jgi:protein ImuA
VIQVERNKDNIVSALRAQILRLEGFRTDHRHSSPALKADPIQCAFPGGVFATGCTHEFLLTEAENFSATGAFVSAIIPLWVKPDGVIVWISSDQHVMPTSLPAFGVKPDHVVFVQARDKDVLWVAEEALKCGAIAAVVCEARNITFTQSRRLQLAVEQSKTTGFLLRHVYGKPGPTAAVSRWRIQHRPSEAVDGLPGIGFPTWNVELLRVRNGRPGTWEVRWADEGLEYLAPAGLHDQDEHVKVG